MDYLKFFEQIPLWALLALVAWTLFWKGMALWPAARGGRKKWFIALVAINTFGLLEIVYLLFFRKRREKKQ